MTSSLLKKTEDQLASSTGPCTTPIASRCADSMRKNRGKPKVNNGSGVGKHWTTTEDLFPRRLDSERSAEPSMSQLTSRVDFVKTSPRGRILFRSKARS